MYLYEAMIGDVTVNRWRGDEASGRLRILYTAQHCARILDGSRVSHLVVMAEAAVDTDI